MSPEEKAAFNADWLAAWTAKDVAKLLTFYAEDCVYMDPQTAGGLKGRAALGAYLTQLFAATPPMTYTPDEIWPTADGFCGRWYCDIGGEGGAVAARLRGFDLVVLRGREIALNEVYTHQLPA
jgi:ketosteroid isomerase-like protein